MSELPIKRRLAAILAADIAGYSRLMADDEEATARTLGTYRLDTSTYPSNEMGLQALRSRPQNLPNWAGPYLPKEIGWYIPGAKIDTKLAVGSGYPNHKVDYVYSFIRYRPEKGHIWFNSLFNGFMIAELIDNPLRKATTTTTGN